MHSKSKATIPNTNGINPTWSTLSLTCTGYGGEASTTLHFFLSGSSLIITTSSLIDSIIEHGCFCYLTISTQRTLAIVNQENKQTQI